MLGLVAIHGVLPDELLLLVDRVLVELFQQLLAVADVGDEGVAAVLGEVLAHDDAQHLELAGVGRHRVGGDDPAARPQPVRQRELVVVALLRVGVRGRGEPEGDERQALARLLAHDDEAEGRESVRQVVGGAGQVRHDGPVAFLS